MHHKRSVYGKLKHDIRELDYKKAQKEIARERKDLWKHAYYDKRWAETANTLHFYWLDIEEGEILKDSRLNGLLQRLDILEHELYCTDENHATDFYVKM